jgi:murein L,D-transpeptidase YafK
MRRAALFLVAGLAIPASCARPPPPAIPPAVLPVPPPPLPPCEVIYRLEVRKSERKLVADCRGGARVELRVALSRAPEGPKRRSGDWKTPEGTYRISGPPRESRYHLFVPIDYPSRADVEAGLRDGVISRRTAERLLAGLARGELPPQDSPLGGTLGFHGEGERWRGDSEVLDWTYGCFALADADMEFIARRAPVGTPVVILP